MSQFWRHVILAAAIFLLITLIARGVDWLLRRRTLTPEAATRYRFFRRVIVVAIVVVGFFSALLAIIVGFASQRTLGNVVAGLLIAVTQPIRLGDRVEYEGTEGVIEEIN